MCFPQFSRLHNTKLKLLLLLLKRKYEYILNNLSGNTVYDKNGSRLLIETRYFVEQNYKKNILLYKRKKKFCSKQKQKIYTEQKSMVETERKRYQSESDTFMYLRGNP